MLFDIKKLAEKFGGTEIGNTFASAIERDTAVKEMVLKIKLKIFF